MTLTFGNIIAIILVAIGIEITCLFVAAAYESKMLILISIPIIAVCVVVMIFGLSWWNTHTASGVRSVKEYKSEFNNGLEREITITAEDGREIFHYEGKVDIETKHDGNANYILFESEEGQRYLIYYGITDTVLIIEKEVE